jgi:hypothetical protein
MRVRDLSGLSVVAPVQGTHCKRDICGTILLARNNRMGNFTTHSTTCRRRPDTEHPIREVIAMQHTGQCSLPGGEQPFRAYTRTCLLPTLPLLRLNETKCSLATVCRGGVPQYFLGRILRQIVRSGSKREQTILDIAGSYHTSATSTFRALQSAVARQVTT